MSDTGRNKTIVTVIKRVDRLPVAREAALVVIYGMDLGRKFNFDRPTIIIGRSSKADIHIDQEEISRNHCKIDNSENGIAVTDLGSTNGTFVNEEAVTTRILTDGDLVKVGRCIFKFLSGDNIENAYHEEIYRLTTVDGLTQIFNKRYFAEMLERELGRATRYHRSLSLIMFDIDHFKNINDTHGHLAGDEVLRALAGIVRSRIRREDILARYGGEEFAIILPEIDHEHALQFAEKVRHLVEGHRFTYDSIDIPVTVSVGLASALPGMLEPSEFVKEADARLYAAKEQGRNRVVG